jgi:hypothetical protein
MSLLSSLDLFGAKWNNALNEISQTLRYQLGGSSSGSSCSFCCMNEGAFIAFVLLFLFVVAGIVIFICSTLMIMCPSEFFVIVVASLCIAYACYFICRVFQLHVYRPFLCKRNEDF